jgi:hypothetical protein
MWTVYRWSARATRIGLKLLHRIADTHLKVVRSDHAPSGASELGRGMGCMKKMIVFVALLAALGVLTAPAIAGGKGPKSAGTSSIKLEPYSELSLGGDVGFSTTAVGLAGWEYPMVAVSCYQDVNGDGTVDTNLLGPDVVYTWLDHPDAEFLLGAYSSIWTLRGGGPAECRAELDAYGWKSGNESTRVLDALAFHAAD